MRAGKTREEPRARAKLQSLMSTVKGGLADVVAELS